MDTQHHVGQHPNQVRVGRHTGRCRITGYGVVGRRRDRLHGTGQHLRQSTDQAVMHHGHQADPATTTISERLGTQTFVGLGDVGRQFDYGDAWRFFLRVKARSMLRGCTLIPSSVSSSSARRRAPTGPCSAR